MAGMSISPYIAGLREHVGHGLLLLPSVSGVVVDDAGRVLLERRADSGGWNLPSGAVDPGEQPADALAREVYEETGLRVAVERLAGMASHFTRYPNGDRCQYMNAWFRCRPVSGTARVNDEESLAVEWFAPDRLPDLHPYVLRRIETALGDDTAAWFVQPGEDYAELSASDVA